MLVLHKLQIIIDEYCKLFRCYVNEIIIMMFILLFFSWTIAFIANGFFGYNFDLQSCWGGFSAIGGAGVLAAIKYCTDSWQNSPKGKLPDEYIKAFDKNNDGVVSMDEIIEVLKDKTKLGRS